MKPITPRTLDWIDHAPVSITRTRRIATSTVTLWDAIADHQSWTNWFQGISKVEVLGVGEGVGGGRRVHVGPAQVDEEFLAWEPGAHFAFTVTHVSQKVVKSLVESVRLIADGPDATTVSYTMAIDPAGARVAAPILRRAIPGALDRGLAGLDRYVAS